MRLKRPELLIHPIPALRYLSPVPPDSLTLACDQSNHKKNIVLGRMEQLNFLQGVKCFQRLEFANHKSTGSQRICPLAIIHMSDMQ